MASPDPFVLRIDAAGTAPVYRQIVDGLRAMLVAGALEPGAKLPTVRQLAVDLGVNHNTVAGAYRLLAEEGWLELRRHHGAQVIRRSAPAAHPAAERKFIQHLRELAARAVADGLDAGTVSGHLKSLADELKNSTKTNP